MGRHYLGFMFYPVPWSNQFGNGLTFDSEADTNSIFMFEGPDYPQPDEVCEGPTTGDAKECSGCSVKGCATYVLTNYTFIPGDPTLPDEMYDEECGNCRPIEDVKSRKHPWASPGTAPVFGEGCGAAGGNPYGCLCGEKAPGAPNFCYGNDTRPYGSCCQYVRDENL